MNLPIAAEITEEFRDELRERFSLTENFVKHLFPERFSKPGKLTSWEDMANGPDNLSRSYIHFALSNVIRGRQARDRIIRKTAKRGGRSLDVGSAYGGMVVAFAEMGFDANGVEIDDFWCGLGNLNCREHGFGELIRNEDFLSAEYEEKYDVITCNDVIEHVMEPRRAIMKMSDMLDDDGVMYLVVPNARSWDHVVRDGHYGAFGMNLLDHYAAREYYNLSCRSRHGKEYSCGEFYPWEWYCEVLEGAGCEVHVAPTNAGGEQLGHALEDMLGKLEEAHSRWKPEGLPEILVDLVERKYLEYMDTLGHDYANASAGPARVAFRRKYLDPFWTIYGRKKAD